MTPPPLISICVPSYNVSLYIAETITCWQSQNYQNLEIIIQDDCSTDDTFKIATEISKKDNRVRVYKNPKNYGIGENWNQCYAKANGEFVVIFNGDDLIPNNFIEILLPLLEQDQTLDFASCAFKYWILGKNQEYRYENTYNKMPDGNVSNINELLLTRHPFSHVFTIHRRSSLEKLLLPNENLFILHQVCDYELWMRMGIAGFKGFHTNEIFGKYRKHLSNNSYIHNAEFSGTEKVLKHHYFLKKQNYSIYKKWLLYNIVNHLKSCIRRRTMPHFKSVLLLAQYYFK
jgi:glycosyltransferase involved in cell wall biosynthesis